MTQSTLDDYRSTGVKCPTCGQDDFANQQGMKSHHAQVHGEKLPTGSKFLCDWCGNTFHRRESSATGDHVFCGEDCWGSYYSENIVGEKHHSWKGGPVLVECCNCGQAKEVNRKQVEDKERFFCGNECRGEWQQRNFTGQDNPAWNNGGSSPYLAVRTQLHGESWSNIAERIRDKADHECENCGESPDYALDVHHVVPVLAGGVNEDELLMALCDTCHPRVEAYCSDLPGFEPLLAE